jgi:ABC-2 type transport system permease protein
MRKKFKRNNRIKINFKIDKIKIRKISMSKIITNDIKKLFYTLKACLSLFGIKIAEGLQYRLAGLAGASTSIFWALIEITVYTVFYRYADNKSASLIAGLDLRQIISYAWLTQVFFVLQPMSIDGEILSKITSGDIGIELCRPINLYTHWFAKIAAGRLAPLLCRGGVVLLAGLIMPSSYRLSLPASLPGLLGTLLSILGAILLCTSFGMLVTTIRLGITWGDGPTYMIMLLGGVLSGGYLPLQLWPEFMKNFLLLQPFAGYLDLPLRLYLGVLPPQKIVWAVTMQLFWSLIFIAAGKILMSIRLRKIIVQGG